MSSDTVKATVTSQLRQKLVGKPLVGFDTTHWGELGKDVSTKSRVGGKDGKAGVKTGKVGVKTGKVGVKTGKVGLKGAPART